MRKNSFKYGRVFSIGLFTALVVMGEIHFILYFALLLLAFDPEFSYHA